MSYLPLARKYRPSRFDELVGQDAVALALANAIRLGRLPHAVIFSGVRGIGKTTTARLYSKALNCESGPTPEPCDVCESCQAIARGTHEDVLEIDGASNTGVDDVRILQESLGYVPQRSKYKIYIIDEVHMLSQSAFNALLKTLEEPPPHVVFIFATTELGKVPETILSRCQTFHLQRLAVKTIVDRLSEILRRETVEFEDAALALIAREGRGSMRDSLTLLDQAIAHGDGRVTVDQLKGLVSNLSSGPYLDLLKALVAREAPSALAVIADWDQAGVSLRDAVEEAAKFARHAFVVKGIGCEALDTALLGLGPDEVSRLEDIAQSAALFDLNRIFRTLVKCCSELNGSELDRFVLENYAFEWCLDPGLPSVEALLSGGAMPVGGGEAMRPPQSVSHAPDAPAGRESGANERREKPKDLMAAFKKTVTGPTPAPAEGPADEKKEPPRDAAPPAAEPVAQVATAPVKEPEPSPAVDEPTAPSAPPDLRQLLNSLKAPGANVPKRPAEPAPQTPRAMAADSQAPAPVATAAAAVAPTPSAAATSAPVFPGSWRELVDDWKRLKPLQARIIEEAYLVDYGPERIIVAVDPSSLAAGKLLQLEIQRKIQDQFKAMFGFAGEFAVRRLDDPTAGDEARGEAVPTLGGQELAHKETILDVRRREIEQAKSALLEEVHQHPITQEALAVFGGKIEAVRLTDP